MKKNNFMLRIFTFMFVIIFNTVSLRYYRYFRIHSHVLMLIFNGVAFLELMKKNATKIRIPNVNLHFDFRLIKKKIQKNTKIVFKSQFYNLWKI